MPKKIVFVIDLIIKGGGAQKVLKLAMDILANAGYEVSLIVLKKTQTDIDYSPHKVYYLLDDLEKKLLPHSFEIIQKIRQISKDAQVLCSCMDFITNYFCTIAYSVRLIKEQKFFTFVMDGSAVISEKEILFPQADLNFNLNLNCIKSAHKVIVNSEFCKQSLIKNGVKNPIVLYNPYNPLPPKQTKASSVNSEPYAICVGRLAKEKNYKTIIKAFALAGCKNLKLLVLGDGYLKDELISLAKGFDIEFLGFRDDVLELLMGAKFFIHASRFEGSPNAVLEAFALAKPAILSDIAPCREIYGKNALYVDCDDINGLAKAIKKLDEKPYTFSPDLSRFSVSNFKTKLLEIFKG